VVAYSRSMSSGILPGSEFPIDPKIEEALRDLTPPRVANILLLIGPDSDCDPLRLALTALGHCVVIAKSKEEALECYYDKAFDLVICDRGSEHTTCDEFAAYLRSLDPRQRILVTDFGRTPS
jgi:hypothetical protein